MPAVTLALGMFAFETDSLPYNALSRASGFRHASSDRFGAAPATQYLGPAQESVSISGSVFPGQFGDYQALDRLHEMAATGEAWPLIDGKGRVYGKFHIESIDEGQTAHFENGIPRKADFKIELKAAG